MELREYMQKAAWGWRKKDIQVFMHIHTYARGHARLCISPHVCLRSCKTSCIEQETSSRENHSHGRVRTLCTVSFYSICSWALSISQMTRLKFSDLGIHINHRLCSPSHDVLKLNSHVSTVLPHGCREATHTAWMLLFPGFCVAFPAPMR